MKFCYLAWCLLVPRLFLLSSFCLWGGICSLCMPAHFLVCVSWTVTGQPRNSVFIRRVYRDKSPFSFVKRQDSIMWDIVWVSPQGHRSVSVSRHFLLQAPQCPCSMRKRFSRDHCCRGRSKPGCRIVGSHTKWELTTWADFQLCLHRLLMSTGCSVWGWQNIGPQITL